MATASQTFAAKRRAVFLEELAKCGNVTSAARVAGVTPRRLYQVRAVEPAFAQAWDEAAELGVQALEDEARRRAYDGTEEPLTSAKGLIYGPDGAPMMTRKYSDTLLIFLLKGARPQKYRERVDVKAHVEGSMSHEHNIAADSELSAIAGAFLRRLAAPGTSDPGGTGVSGE